MTYFSRNSFDTPRVLTGSEAADFVESTFVASHEDGDLSTGCPVAKLAGATAVSSRTGRSFREISGADPNSETYFSDIAETQGD
jgi:hypothetical protein